MVSFLSSEPHFKRTIGLWVLAMVTWGTTQPGSCRSPQQLTCLLEITHILFPCLFTNDLFPNISVRNHFHVRIQDYCIEFCKHSAAQPYISWSFYFKTLHAGSIHALKLRGRLLFFSASIFCLFIFKIKTTCLLPPYSFYYTSELRNS